MPPVLSSDLTHSEWLPVGMLFYDSGMVPVGDHADDAMVHQGCSWDAVAVPISDDQEQVEDDMRSPETDAVRSEGGAEGEAANVAHVEGERSWVLASGKPLTKGAKAK